MKRNTINFIIDSAGLLFLIALAISGFILEEMPHGHGQGYGYRGGRGEQTGPALFWSLSRHNWRDIHFWIAIVFMVLISIHIILHWSWIKSLFKSCKEIEKQEP